MADDQEVLNVLLSPEKMKLNEFIRRYANKFPLIVITDRDYYGNLGTIPEKKLLLVSHVLSQGRLILKSKKCGSVSIPEHFPIALERINIFGRVVKRESVWDYMNQPKIEKSQKIRFVTPFDDLLISNVTSLTSSNLGLMTFHNIVTKQFLVVHPLKNDNINFDPTAILVESDLEVQIVEGHKDMTDSAWSELLERCKLALDKISNVVPPELENVFVHAVSETTPTKHSKYGHHLSYYNSRFQHPQPQPSSYRSQVVPFETETTKMVSINEGVRGMKLLNSERHVTITTNHDNGRSTVARQQNARSSRDQVNLKESSTNTNINFNGYNNGRIIPSRPSYRADQSNVDIQTGQQSHRLNIDQKAPRIQNTSSIKYGNTRQEPKMVNSFGELQTGPQRLAVLGKTSQPQNQRIIKMDDMERGNRRSKSYGVNNSIERTASESLFMQITESDADSEGNFRESRLNKTFDNAGLPPEKLLQVPNVQYGRIDNNRTTQLDKNSKSLGDLRFERLPLDKSKMKEESDDADVENESQITVICGKPYFDDRFKVQTKKPLKVSEHDLTDRNDPRQRFNGAVTSSMTNGGSYKLVPKAFTNGNKHPLHAMPSRESYASRVSGQESDTSNIYLRYRRPVAKKYLKRFKYSSDVDFSGSEDLPRHKGIPYGYMEPDYHTRMKMRRNRSYLNSTSDLETVLRSKASFGQNDYSSDAYVHGFQNVRGNRLSSSSMVLDPALYETSHMYRRNITHGPLDGRHRNRSSPAKVVFMNRQGQIMTREIPANYFSSLQSQQTTPASRTLISLNNGNSSSQSNLRRPIRDNPQGMYKQVINIR